jgi:hypothetical protein
LGEVAVPDEEHEFVAFSEAGHDGRGTTAEYDVGEMPLDDCTGFIGEFIGIIPKFSYL